MVFNFKKQNNAKYNIFSPDFTWKKFSLFKKSCM